jgi:serine/threonine protein kinase
MSTEVTTGRSDGGTATPLLSSNALPVGTRVLEFEITRVIGEGGFSVVYLAFDHTLHRSIALKEYIPSALASRRGDNTVAVRSAQHQETFEAGLRSFINEARLLAQFDHPALVKVYRFWEANGTAYMAMPYYGGRTLRDILRADPAQASEAWLKKLLVPLLDALELLHAHRCYHRDVAPDNIQVLENGAPVLLDFGAARRTIGDMTQAFTVILKPGYAPIEQYADEADLKQGPWTDVYALAAVLYGAIVHKPPPTAVARVIKDPLEPLATRALAGYGTTFLAGIDSGLAVRPEARPQSVREWRGLLGMDDFAATTVLHARDATATHLTVPPVSPPAAATEIAPQTPIGIAPRPPTAQVEAPAALPAGDDEDAHGDRTVLVPGLRRPPPATSPEHAPATAPQSARTARRLHVPVLIGAAVAGIVIVALVLTNVFSPSSPSSVATGEPPVPSATPEKAADTARAEPPPPPLATARPREAPRVDAAAATRPASAEPPATPAPPPAPVVTEDDRRWAEIRDSDNIADFMAFQLRFPKSTHAQEASARIRILERQAQERARVAAARESSTAKSSAQSAAAAESKRPKRAEAPRPSVGASGPAATAAGVTQAPSPGSPSVPTAAVPATAATSAPATAAMVPPPATSSAASAAAPASAPAGRAVVRIRVQPFGYVYVDGTLVGASPPMREVAVSPGKHRIEARNDAAHPPVVATDIDVSGNAPRDVRLSFGE